MTTRIFVQIARYLGRAQLLPIRFQGLRHHLEWLIITLIEQVAAALRGTQSARLLSARVERPSGTPRVERTVKDLSVHRSTACRLESTTRPLTGSAVALRPPTAFSKALGPASLATTIQIGVYRSMPRLSHPTGSAWCLAIASGIKGCR